MAESEVNPKPNTMLHTSSNYSAHFAVDKCFYFQCKFIPQLSHVKGRAISGSWKETNFFNIAL